MQCRERFSCWWPSVVWAAITSLLTWSLPRRLTDAMAAGVMRAFTPTALPRRVFHLAMQKLQRLLRRWLLRRLLFLVLFKLVQRRLWRASRMRAPVQALWLLRPEESLFELLRWRLPESLVSYVGALRAWAAGYEPAIFGYALQFNYPTDSDQVVPRPVSPTPAARGSDGAADSQSNDSGNLFNDSATRTRDAASAGRRSPGHFDYSSSSAPTPAEIPPAPAVRPSPSPVLDGQRERSSLAWGTIDPSRVATVWERKPSLLARSRFGFFNDPTLG